MKVKAGSIGVLIGLLALLAASLAPGCGGGDGGGDGGMVNPPMDADIAGTWDLSWNQSNPPRTATCTSPLSLEFVIYLEVSITQNGKAFTGTCSPVYAGNSFSTSGTVSGNTVTGTLVRTDGTYTDRIVYTATVSGDTMTVRPTRYTQDWNPGFSCTCAGEWIANRR